MQSLGVHSSLVQNRAEVRSTDANPGFCMREWIKIVQSWLKILQTTVEILCTRNCRCTKIGMNRVETAVAIYVSNGFCAGPVSL